jgi:hypothetical protein
MTGLGMVMARSGLPRGASGRHPLHPLHHVDRSIEDVAQQSKAFWFQL